MPDTEFELRFAAVTREAQAAISALSRTLGELNAQTDRGSQSFAASKVASDGFFASLRAGVGIDLGGKVVNALQQIPGILTQAAKDGVAFNATLERSRISVASLLATFQPEKFRSVGAALNEAGAAVELLKQRAAESPATFESLLAGFQSLSAPAFRAGIALEKQVELTVLLSQALATLGLAAEQLPQEARAILTGDANNPDATLARTLQIKNEDIQRARQTGTVFEYIAGRLQAFREGSELASKSYTVLASNLGDNLQEIKALATKGIFEDLKVGLEVLTNFFASDKAKAGAIAAKNFLGDLGAGLKTAGGIGAGLGTALQNILPAAGAASFIAGSYQKEAEAELKRQREEKEIARLREALISARTQADFDNASRAISIAPYARTGDPLSDGARAKLQLLQREFKTLADVEKARAEEAAKTAKAREDELNTAIRMATLGKTEEEKQRGLAELVRLQGLETSKIENVDNERLGIITRTIQAVQGTTTALQQSGEALRPLVGGADEIKKTFAALPALLRQLQEQGRSGQERLADVILGGDQRGRLGLLDQQIKRTRDEIDELVRRAGLPIGSISSAAPQNSGSGNGLFAGPPLRRGGTLPAPLTPLNIPELDDEVVRAATESATRSAAFQSALEQIIRDNIAKRRSDPDLGKKLEGDEKTLLEQIIAKQGQLLELEGRRVQQGRAVTEQRKEESDIARQIAIANARTRDDNETILQVKKQQLIADIEARELKAGGERAANAAATARAEAEAQLQADRAEFERTFAIKELENARQAIAAKRQLADGDRAQLRALNEEEIRILQKLIAKWEAYNRAKEGSTAPEDKETVSANKVAIAQAQASLQKLRQQNDRSSPLGAAEGAAKDFFQSIGDSSKLAGDLVTGSLTTAFNGVGTAIAGLIQGTQTLGQTFTQTGLQMLVMLAQLIVKFLLLQALVLTLNAIGALFGNPTLGSDLLKVVSRVPGAREGGFVPGYAGGGLVSALPFLSGPPNSDDTTPAWLMPGEFVVRRSAAQRYGPLLEAINNFQLPITMPAAFAGGGSIGGSFSANRAGTFGRGGVILVDDRDQAARLREDPRHSRDQVYSVNRLLEERGIYGGR